MSQLCVTSLFNDHCTRSTITLAYVGQWRPQNTFLFSESTDMPKSHHDNFSQNVCNTRSFSPRSGHPLPIPRPNPVPRRRAAHPALPVTLRHTAPGSKLGR